MTYTVNKIKYEINNDEGLSYLFFELEEGYFTVTNSEDNTDVYMELNTQSNGEYFMKDCLDIVFHNGRVCFSIDLNNRKILEYLNQYNKNYKMYENMEFQFIPVSEDFFSDMLDIYQEIFG